VSKALILIDVDGPLNPYAAKPTQRPEGYETHRLAPKGWDPRKPLRVWLNPSHGPLLLSLAEAGAELVWCTTWEHDANTMIGPAIGLPELPVIEFGFNALQWKFNAVLTYARGRPLVWFDDDFPRFPQERNWFVDRRIGINTWLYHINPAIGLKEHDVDTAYTWLKGLPP